jgi:predicted polyphosphate/ATP-dependent NAD kinase
MTENAAESDGEAFNADLVQSIAKDLSENLEEDHLYVFGSGDFTQAVLGHIPGNNGFKLVSCCDLKNLEPRSPLWSYFENKKVRLVVCPDEDGRLLRIESEDISPQFLSMVDKGCFQIIADMKTLTNLKGLPITVATGSSDLDKKLAGYTQVITSYRRRAMYPVTAL